MAYMVMAYIVMAEPRSGRANGQASAAPSRRVALVQRHGQLWTRGLVGARINRCVLARRLQAAFCPQHSAVATIADGKIYIVITYIVTAYIVMVADGRIDDNGLDAYGLHIYGLCGQGGLQALPMRACATVELRQYVPCGRMHLST